MEITKTLAAYGASLRFEQIPPEIVRVAEERILDNLGAAFAGVSYWPYATALLKALPADGDAGVFAQRGKRNACLDAAFLNSTLTHAVELDDGHKNAGCHAGAVVVPTALLLGRMEERSAEDILTAIVVGYEIEYRIAAAASPLLIDRGFHPSTACAAFGAAATAAKIKGLDEEAFAAALALAGAFTSGLKQMSKSAPMAKAIAVGNAASNGVRAALLAAQGVTGPMDIMEGPFGFFSLLSDGERAPQTTTHLGSTWLIADTYVKLYPTCRHTHPAIEGLIELTKDVSPEEIQEIDVGMYRVAHDATAKFFMPHNAGEAKFSTPFCSALAVSEGSVGLGHMDGAWLTSPKLLALAQKVRMTVDPAVESLFPKVRGARVKVKLVSGEVREKQVNELKGSPTMPASWEELVLKFGANSRDCLSGEMADRIVDIIDSFTTKDQLQQLWALIF